MKVGDLVRFGADYPSGRKYGVGMIVGCSEDMSGDCHLSGMTVLWKVLFAIRMHGWIRSDQLRVIDESR
jgi:hypothetical protein